MRKIALGWKLIFSLGPFTTTVLTISLPLIVILVAYIAGYTAITLGSAKFGTFLMRTCDAITNFMFEPLLLTPVKLLIAGILLVTLTIAMLDFISPSILDRKFLEKSARDYVLYKLKGENEIAEELEKEIALINLRMLRYRQGRSMLW